MQNPRRDLPTTGPLERLLAVAGAVIGIIVSIRIGWILRGQQPIWPLPGLYLVELAALSATGALGSFRETSVGVTTVWVVAGAFLGFAVMGAWFVGPAYSPVALMFVLAAILANRRQGRSMAPQAALGLVATIVQAALMLATVRLLNPDAIF